MTTHKTTGRAASGTGKARYNIIGGFLLEAGKTAAFRKLRRTLSGCALWAFAAAAVSLATWTGTLRAGTIYVPNYSFESPVVPESFPYATNALDEWEESPQPSDYYPAQNYGTPWSYLVGTFYNVPYPGEYINNVDGIQAAFLQAYPEVGIFQDYNSIGGTNTVPDHAFNATFKAGKAYTLTVGLTSSSDEPLTSGSTLQLSLYYRDNASNQVIVASNNVAYDPNVFTNLTQLIDFQVQVPGVKATDPGPDRILAFSCSAPQASSWPEDIGMWTMCAWSKRPP